MNKKLLYIACLTMTLTAMQAQKKAAQDTVLRQQLILEREYNPVFRDASRIDQLPQITEPKIAKSPIQYQFNTLNANFPLQWKTIQPEKKMGHPNFTNQKGYANFGIGLQTNTYGNAGILLVDDAANKLSVTFDHRLSNDRRKIMQSPEKKTIFSTDNALRGNYSHEFEKSALDLFAGYKHSAFNFFGLPSDTTLTNLDSLSTKNQAHNQFFMGGELRSLEGSPVKYKAGVKYGYFGKRLSSLDTIAGNKEHQFAIDGDISGRFLENSRIGLEFSLINFIYKADRILDTLAEKSIPENYGLLRFTPHYDIEGENYSVRLGLKSDIHFATKNRFNIAPSISGKWEFAPRFYLNGEFGGGSEVYSFEKTDAEYRYIDPSIRLKDTFTPLDATISIRTNAIPMFGFELLTGYKSGEEYYMTSQRTGNRVNVLTPHLSDVKQFKVGLLAQFNYEKILDLQMKLMKYSYEVNPEENVTATIQAWNKPDFEFSLDGNYNVNEKLSLQMNYYLASGRYALKSTKSPVYILTPVETIKMKPINNLSAGGRYTLTKKLSVFTQLNNILFQKYDLWYGMPAQNFNFIAGVGITF